MTQRTLGLDDRLHEYLTRTFLREPEVMRELRAETARLGEIARMQIAPEQGQLMGLLLELIGARLVIEIGTFTGYSALAMARALPDDGRLIACDVSEEWTRIARRYWLAAGVAGKIDLRLGPGLATLEALEAEGLGGRVDAAFVDADKAGYDLYYERLLRLLRPGGLIMIDNAYWGARAEDPQGRTPETEAVRALNAKLRDDERVTLALVPVAGGLTLARKREVAR
ncbi:MAG: class I SAM-dependent methyltransferase [Candidatus Eisenbacteria bacterium]|uniref:Class I SAM-dependent methyltransferase n=1 Tax=Eiseniibacteriota bacterium TaxID=2212470 RepID=A0A938BMI7_UNCEI|nr:class I SAM-dependent methyltransferase [Candidatus Eisenbacteria bacterium]